MCVWWVSHSPKHKQHLSDVRANSRNQLELLGVVEEIILACPELADAQTKPWCQIDDCIIIVWSIQKTWNTVQDLSHRATPERRTRSPHEATLRARGAPPRSPPILISALLKSSSDPRHDCSTWPLSVKPVLKMARETSWVRARILLTLSSVTFNYCAMSLNIELTTINIMEQTDKKTKRQTDKKSPGGFVQHQGDAECWDRWKQGTPGFSESNHTWK